MAYAVCCWCVLCFACFNCFLGFNLYGGGYLRACCCELIALQAEAEYAAYNTVTVPLSYTWYLIPGTIFLVYLPYYRDNEPRKNLSLAFLDKRKIRERMLPQFLLKTYTFSNMKSSKKSSLVQYPGLFEKNRCGSTATSSCSISSIRDSREDSGIVLPSRL